jgi:hypothetical protein
MARSPLPYLHYFSLMYTRTLIYFSFEIKLTYNILRKIITATLMTNSIIMLLIRIFIHVTLIVTAKFGEYVTATFGEYHNRLPQSCI